MTESANETADVTAQAEPVTDVCNRTGIAGSRARSVEMLAGAAEFAPACDDADLALREARVRSARDGLRVPGGVQGCAPGIARLLDKLGERLSSERTSVRLYEALLAKYDALDVPPAVPTRVELERVLREEFEHYRMLEEMVAELRGDPTALTPSAELAATMCRGLLEVLLDPCTHFAQGLEAVLIAELADREAWRVVAAFAEQAGETSAAARLRGAVEREGQHVAAVRTWLTYAHGLTTT
ncbi:MAG: ferritin-like domain-containing protein [Polyangiales bacterium]